MRLFIEICSAKESWLALDETARRQFLSAVGPLMKRLEEEGVEIVAWGENSADTPERASFDYFGVFKFPDAAAVVRYESTFRAAGWYDYFEQVNICGDCESYETVLKRLAVLAPVR